MQSVSIRTTQNVQLDYPLAGIADRILAFLIDAFIILSFFLFTWFLMSQLGFEMDRLTQSIIGIIAYSFRLIQEVINNGQTIGKMALNIKVVKLDGSKPSISAYFLRWLLEPIDFFITGLGVVVIIFTKNGQRIGDLLAGTTVVKIKKISLTNVRNKVIMEQVDENYVPNFPQAADLTDTEIRLIKRALMAFKDKAHLQPLVTLENKLKEKYQISSDMPSVRFMYALLRDHTFYMNR